MKLTGKINWKSVCIIIPAHNEELSIGAVICELKKLSKLHTIVVINDGSTDKTSEIAKQNQVYVIDLPFNTGIGGAVQTGLKFAHQNKFKLAIQVDADGQHPPSEIPKLLSKLNQDTDLLIGSRFIKPTTYHALPSTLLGIKLFSKVIRLLYGENIADPTSGFRVFTARSIAFFSNEYPVDFPEPESIVQLLKRHYTVQEVSVQMKARKFGFSSLQNLKGYYLVASILLSLLVSAVKK